MDTDLARQLGECCFGVVASPDDGLGDPSAWRARRAWSLDVDSPDTVANRLHTADSPTRSVATRRDFHARTLPKSRRGLMLSFNALRVVT